MREAGEGDARARRRVRRVVASATVLGCVALVGCTYRTAPDVGDGRPAVRQVTGPEVDPAMELEVIVPRDGPREPGGGAAADRDPVRELNV